MFCWNWFVAFIICQWSTLHHYTTEWHQCHQQPLYHSLRTTYSILVMYSKFSKNKRATKISHYFFMSSWLMHSSVCFPACITPVVVKPSPWPFLTVCPLFQEPFSLFLKLCVRLLPPSVLLFMTSSRLVLKAEYGSVESPIGKLILAWLNLKVKALTFCDNPTENPLHQWKEITQTVFKDKKSTAATHHCTFVIMTNVSI